MFGKFVREDVHMYERKKIAVVFVFTLCLISALAITFGSFLSKAKSKEPEVTYYKYYTNIEIQPGDTLWSLAENYMCENYESRDAYIKEVKEIIKDSKKNKTISLDDYTGSSDAASSYLKDYIKNNKEKLNTIVYTFESTDGSNYYFTGFKNNK